MFEWFVMEFIGFGDLVSDLALVATPPSSDDVDDGSHPVTLWLLWGGTFISCIPLVALMIGICTGLVVVVAATLGAATRSAEGTRVLKSNFDQTRILLRYALSDSKTITRFVVFFAAGVPRKWDNAATLVAGFCLYVPLFPVAYPLVRALKFWIDFVAHHNGVRAVDGPSRQPAEAEGEEDSEEEEIPGLLWCLPLVFLQNIGTFMTLAYSIDVAISLRDDILSEAIAAPVASIVFGIYFLWVSFPAPKEGVSRESLMEESFEQRMRNQAFADEEIIGVVRSRKFWLSFPAAVAGLAVLALPFVGLYFSQTASYHILGVILASIGFALLGVLCWLALKGSLKTICARLAFLLSVPALISVGVGLVFTITRGYSDRNGNLFAGGLLVLLFTVPCGVREYFFSSTAALAALQAKAEEEQARWREIVEEYVADQEEPRQAERHERRQAAGEDEPQARENQARRIKQEAEHAKRMEMTMKAMEEAMEEAMNPMNLTPGLVGDDEASKIEDEAFTNQAVQASKAYAKVWADISKQYTEGVGNQASRSAGGEPSTAFIEASTASVSRASMSASETCAESVRDQASENAIEASMAAMAAMMEASKQCGETIGDQAPEKAMESFVAAMAVMTEASKKYAENGNETRDG